MSVHAAALQVRAGIAWPRIVLGLALLALMPLGVFAVLGAGWPPILLAVPAAVPVLLVPVVRGLRTASRRIDTILAEELGENGVSLEQAGCANPRERAA
jgi:hypothetical protein